MFKKLRAVKYMNRVKIDLSNLQTAVDNNESLVKRALIHLELNQISGKVADDVFRNKIDIEDYYKISKEIAKKKEIDP